MPGSMKIAFLIMLVIAQCLWLVENASTTNVVGTSNKPRGTTASPSVKTRALVTGQHRGTTSSYQGGSVATYASNLGSTTVYPRKYSVKTVAATGSSIATVKPKGSTASRMSTVSMMSTLTGSPMTRKMATTMFHINKSSMNNMGRRMTTSSGMITGRGMFGGKKMPKGKGIPTSSATQTRTPFTMITRMPHMRKEMASITLRSTGSGMSTSGGMPKDRSRRMGQRMFSGMSHMMTRNMRYILRGEPTSSRMTKDSIMPTSKPMRMMMTSKSDMGRRMSTNREIPISRRMPQMGMATNRPTIAAIEISSST